MINFEKTKQHLKDYFFKDLQDGGLFDMSLNHHKECMEFCFSGMLQNEPDNIKEMH